MTKTLRIKGLHHRDVLMWSHLRPGDFVIDASDAWGRTQNSPDAFVVIEVSEQGWWFFITFYSVVTNNIDIRNHSNTQEINGVVILGAQ